MQIDIICLCLRRKDSVGDYEGRFSYLCPKSLSASENSDRQAEDVNITFRWDFKIFTTTLICFELFGIP